MTHVAQIRINQLQLTAAEPVALKLSQQNLMLHTVELLREIDKYYALGLRALLSTMHLLLKLDNCICGTTTASETILLFTPAWYCLLQCNQSYSKKTLSYSFYILQYLQKIFFL